MIQIRFILYLLISIWISILSINKVHSYLEQYPLSILKSPYKLDMLPMSINIPPSTFYVQINKELPKQENKTQYIFALSPLIAVVLIYSLLSIFLSLHAYKTDRERYFIWFSTGVSIYYLVFIDYLTGYHLPGLLYLLSFFIGFSFVQTFYSLFKKRINHQYIFLGYIISLGVVYYYYPTNYIEEVRMLQIFSGFQLLCLVFAVIKFYKILFNKEYYSFKQKENLLTNILAIALIISFATPIIGYYLTINLPIQIHIRNNAVFFIPAIFPLLYFLFIIRFGLLQSRIVIHDVIVRFLILILFILFYWFFIAYWLIASIKNQETDNFYLDIFVIFVIFIIIEISRAIIYYILDKQTFQRKRILQLYLSKNSQNIYDLYNLAPFIKQTLHFIQSALGVTWAKIYLDSSFLKNDILKVSNINIIDSTDPIWNQINFRKKIWKFARFNKISREPIGSFITKVDGSILIVFHKLSGFILISNKIKEQTFISEDILFLKRITQQIEPLLQNYLMLLMDQNLNRKQYELELAFKIQQTIFPKNIVNKHLSIETFIIPFQKVTGDYIDFFQKSENTYLIFLGDISGHGLGGAYLMSMIRSVIRGMLHTEENDLCSIFTELNNFLIKDYNGNDFLTLIAIELTLDIVNKKIQLQYINAGQHPGIMYDKNTDELFKIANNQRVIGVLETHYKIFTINPNSNSIRLILYSDGVFESFSNNNEMLGEDRINQWIYDSSTLPLNEQKRYIQDKLLESSKKYIINDDISLIFIDITL